MFAGGKGGSKGCKRLPKSNEEGQVESMSAHGLSWRYMSGDAQLALLGPSLSRTSR